jgi:hypothetical protein
MASFNLSLAEDRLKVVDLAFSYPMTPHHRRHGPVYKSEGYESYRDWLRDEFSYRCVFSLIRETWIGRSTSFDIDHLKPQTNHPTLVCNYDNLLYLSHRINLRKGKHSLPDPGKLALGKCLKVEHSGEQRGLITALNKDGQALVETLKLNNAEEVEDRRKWFDLLRATALVNEALFRQLVGFPANLANLDNKRTDDNTRPEGIKQSAYHLRETTKQLPEWY